jgi:tryptophanase
MLCAREGFSGQETHEEFVKTARAVTGFPLIQPVHQGRSAENILFRILLKPGGLVAANTHFETTRANIETFGCEAVDMVRPEPPFNGNLDLTRLKERLGKKRAVRLLIMTLTNNIQGGQAVSLENILAASRICGRRGIPFIIDASRFADNAYLIKDYTRSSLPVRSIVRKMLRFADAVYLSAKKDGLSNIGGMICLRDRKLMDRIAEEVIRQESYPTSGGLAARDLAAMTQGLNEAIDEDFLHYHISSLRFLAGALKKRGVPVYEPVGGHAVVIRPADKRPYAAFSMAGRIFIETGIRGGVFGPDLRLALPRRVYTMAQLSYVADMIGMVYDQPLPRLKPVNRPRSFFNFFARFREY